MPVRGVPARPRPADRAVILLDDRTEVWVEPYDVPAAERPAAERDRFDGRSVRARGTAHRTMPAAGESLVAPCLSDVREIEEES
jgi:hypothetical protein